MVFWITVDPFQKIPDILFSIGSSSGGFVSHSNKEFNSKIFQFIRRRDVSFYTTEMNTAFVTVLRIFLQLDQLNTPGLTERTALFCCLSFWLGCINKHMKVTAGVHQMQYRDSKSTVTTSQTNCHFILFWELKIAMNFPHHIQHNFVCRISPVHASVKFPSSNWADFLTSVIKFLIIVFQPRFKLKASQTTVHLIRSHIGNRANPKKRIDGSSRRSTRSDF